MKRVLLGVLSFSLIGLSFSVFAEVEEFVRPPLRPKKIETPAKDSLKASSESKLADNNTNSQPSAFIDSGGNLEPTSPNSKKNMAPNAGNQQMQFNGSELPEPAPSGQGGSMPSQQNRTGY